MGDIEEARQNVQYTRNALKGIMVGVQTVINDNPSLTCRIKAVQIRCVLYVTVSENTGKQQYNKYCVGNTDNYSNRF